MRKQLTMAAAALILGGCASTYQMTLMPRDSGKLYYGMAEGGPAGEGRIAVTIEEKSYSGTWVQVTAERTNGYVSGGFGGWRRGWGVGGIVTLDNPEGGSAKALLQSADGSGLRCDFRGGSYGFGGGNCSDDKGRIYDVQLRAQHPTKAPS